MQASWGRLLSPARAGGRGGVLRASFGGVHFIPRGGDQAGEFVLFLEVGDVFDLPFANRLVEGDGIGIHGEDIIERGGVGECEGGYEPEFIALLKHVGSDDGDRAGHARAEFELSGGAGAFAHSGFSEGFVVGEEVGVFWFLFFHFFVSGLSWLT